jgi:hypothetical protein
MSLQIQKLKFKIMLDDQMSQIANLASVIHK